MIFNVLSLLNICSVQFIGSRESAGHNLRACNLENIWTPFPIVLDNVNSSFAGKYHLFLIKFSTSSKTDLIQKLPNTYQNKLCSGSGSAAIIFTQWVYNYEISNPKSRVARIIGMILQTMVAFGENPKYLFIETNPASLELFNQQELSVDHARYAINSHIFLYTEFEILLVYGSKSTKPPFYTNFLSMFSSNKTFSPSDFQNQILKKTYNFSGRQVLICDWIIN